jgi:arylsulfatase A-like enzyme
MRPTLRLVLVCLLALPAVTQTEPPTTKPQPSPSPRRNVIIFVADGLRPGSVNERDTPTLWSVRSHGVHFRNSYSVFPTFTTANASAIATGHGLGDTGDYSNTIWFGYASYDTGNYNLAPASPVTFIENDQILGDLDSHFDGNYLGQETLLGLARANGYNTASIGKGGPAAIQDIAAVAPVNGGAPPPSNSIVIDDASGTPAGLPLPPRLFSLLLKEDIPPEAPNRTNGFGATSQYSNAFSGDLSHAGTLRPNLVQEQWFLDVATRGVLPLFAADAEHPFALVYWSRDPDGTQHYQGDSLNGAFPGINGPTSVAGVRNADRSLRRLMDWLDAHPAIKQNTDIVVTSDHGFATISRRETDRAGHPSTAESAQHYYFDASGRTDTEKGTLPPGFLAIDLAVALETNLWDPDRRGAETSRFPFRQVRLTSDAWEHSAFGSGLLGPRIEKADGSDALAIVAANGGSDLIYVPDGNADRVRQIVHLLLGFDYTGAVFVDDKYGEVPGALPLSAINLVGDSKVPRPAIVVAFRTFYLNDKDLQSAILIADTPLQTGQGMHGGFGRDNTYNNMAAIGPDFKTNYVDDAPVSNADIVPTLARIMGIELPRKGKLQGRVAAEALAAQPDAPAVTVQQSASSPADGKATVLEFQELGGVRYLRSASIQKR